MRARATLAVTVIAVAAAAALASEAMADWRIGGVVVVRTDHGHDYRGGYDGRYDREYGRQGPAFRYGFDRGWREGSEEGHSDGRRSRDPRYWRESDFRHADRGYKGWMGPRGDYANGFREGYRAGYQRAYASARPSWRGRWERYGWGGAGDRYPNADDRSYERRDQGAPYRPR